METCPHKDLSFHIKMTIFTDRPGRSLDITGCCKACRAAVRFVGAPIGISLNRPSMSLSGDEIHLPILVGDEQHVPGPDVFMTNLPGKPNA